MKGPMPFERIAIDADTYLADVRMFGQDGFGAIYLIDDDRKALVETATSWEANRIVEAVRGFGLTPSDVDAIIVSHVHLDHAGGAGFLLDSMPNATVYVHERGYKHLVDPTKLVASAKQAVGPEAAAFGTMKPIRPDRLRSVKDQEALDLGRHRVRFLDSPGHAPHELTLLDERNRCVYTGDAAGLYFPGDEILMPVAPAPSFDLEKNLRTFERLLGLNPKALLFSHYGPHRNPKEAIARMASLYPAWSRLVKERLATEGEEGVIRDMYEMTCRNARRYPRDFLERRIRTSVTGLAEYHRRIEHAAPER
jgi:glyoxylase-like metal-dependent hydrolase (beta-lactamase superfamily II)